MRLTTTQRGLGAPHAAERRRQLAAMTDGQQCPRCGAAMYRRQALDLDDFPGRVFGGPQVKRLSHARCNRQAGGILGAILRKHGPPHHGPPRPRTTPAAVPLTRRW